MSITHYRLPVDGEGTLDAVFHEPDRPVAWVLALHGLESDKEGSKYYALAERILPLNMGLVRFDFRGCGKSSGTFGDTNVATRLTDARTLLMAIRSRAGGSRIGLFGSSMGGYVSLFLAGDPDVQATVTLAAPENVDDMVTRNAEAAQRIPAFLAEYEAGLNRKVPSGLSNVLLLHGDADDVVPVAHVDAIWPRLVEPRRKVIYAGGDHRFSDPAHLKSAMDEAVEWFAARLLQPSPLS
jgi:uncharacterized protein